MTKTEARYVFHQEPDHLNPYLFLHSAAGEICNFLCDGLLDYGPTGGYVRRLAREVPTRENGGISGDGTTITYRLRPGLRWSDGTPLTSDAVRFTWEAIVHPDSGSQHRTGYAEIADITCPDPLTAVVQFKDPYAPALALFPCLLPRHASGHPSHLREWAYNHHPLNSGAFRMASWRREDHISAVRNPYYWERGKPYLDSVRFDFVPDRESAIEQLAAGAADAVWSLTEHDVEGLRSVPGVRIVQVPGPVAERLILNQVDPRIEARNLADIQANPHPILGDARVREAIELAINKPELIDRFLAGQARVGTNELHVGWMRYDTRPSEFDPRCAVALLASAGWHQGPDGIREARNSRYASNGSPRRG
jgi:peptide/nickel transport system substrate-binding protein